jgi:hypothetical protein
MFTGKEAVTLSRNAKIAYVSVISVVGIDSAFGGNIDIPELRHKSKS